MNEKQDPLTGRLTGQAFLDGLERMAKSGEGITLLMLDFDRLSVINQKSGQAAGDAWMKLGCDLFAGAFPEAALAGRHHGDEFVLALPGEAMEDAARRADDLRARIAQEMVPAGPEDEGAMIGGTVSISLATLPQQARDAADLLEKVEQAMRRAKAGGGNQVVAYQSMDWLTGVLNRQAIEDALGAAIDRARRGSEPLSVFLLDIDRFKELNDEYGHRAGDEVLKRLGHILESNFRQIGQVGRIAGDEFIVILPGQRADSAFILADEVRRLVEDSDIPIGLGGRQSTLRFHISGGIANFPGDASEPVDLMRKADEALYRSKQIGRNRISLPTSSQMITKTSYYTQIQLERLSQRARELDKTEAFLLREALDDLLRKYGDTGSD